MACVVPTVTEENADNMNAYLAELAGFAPRLHLDFSDGIFAPRRLAPLDQAQWPEGVEIDLHLMFQRPAEQLDIALSKPARLVILHAEADGDTFEQIKLIHEAQKAAGIALLPQTQPVDYQRVIEQADHVLIFGGKLGWQGGEIDLSQIEKIAAIKRINPHAEIAWDGGVNQVNAGRLMDAGVEVLNAGSAIKQAEDRHQAYAILQQISNG